MMPGRTPPPCREEALLPESGKSIWNPAPPSGALPGIQEVGLEPRGADRFFRWLSICPPDTGNVAGALSEDSFPERRAAAPVDADEEEPAELFACGVKCSWKMLSIDRHPGGWWRCVCEDELL